MYRVVADAVMLVHFGFLGFVAWGGALRTVGLECPLTAGENALRRLGDEEGLPRGLIDTYLTGVLYPRHHLPVAQLLVTALVVVSWVGLAVRGPARTWPT